MSKKSRGSSSGGGLKRTVSEKDGPCIEGYLDKKQASGMHNWQKKYFVGKKGLLKYWKNEAERNTSGSKYKKTINLRGAKIKKVVKEGSSKSSEFIIFTTDKEYHLRANTVMEMSQWKETLKEVMNYKRGRSARNASMVASSESVPFIESSMLVTIPGSAPRELWVRVNKQERKMTFAESEKRMREGKANAAASLQLSTARLSKHGSREFRLHINNPTLRSYSFQLSDKSDLQNWVSALLLLDITFLSRGEAESAGIDTSSSSDRSGSSSRSGGTSSSSSSRSAAGAKSSSASDDAPRPETRAIMTANWIKEYDALVADRKRSDAVMVAFTAAERFFQLDDNDESADVNSSVRELEELDIHTTVECAERLIDDLNMRYNDCVPDRMELFELYLAQYNNRLITQFDMIGVSDPDCLAEYTPEELKMLIQLLTTYLDAVVYPAIEGTTIAERVSVDKFETDKQVLIEAYTDKALAIITDILRRSCKKLLTAEPEIYAQSRSAIVRTVTVNDIFRVVLNQLEICEECEVEELNTNMIFSCIKAVQTYVLVVTSYLPVVPFEFKFMCAVANDFSAIREETLKLLNDKRRGGCGYKFGERLRTIGIAEDDPDWAEKMYEQSKDLDNIFTDIDRGRAVAIHALLDNIFQRLNFAEFFTRFDRRTPYDMVFNPLKNSVFPECAKYFGQTDNMKLMLKLCVDHCQINYYHALFRRIRQNDEIKGKFWIKKFGLNTERIGREAKGEDFFRYFRDVNVGRMRNDFRRRDVTEESSLPIAVVVEMLQPYLPEDSEINFSSWLNENYGTDKSNASSKSRIDYLAFTERIRQLEQEHAAARNGGLDNFKRRSLVFDFHKFEDFFRGRVVQYLPEDKSFFSKHLVSRLNVFKGMTDILGCTGERKQGVIQVPDAPFFLVPMFQAHEKCVDEVLHAVELCFNAKTEVEVLVKPDSTTAQHNPVEGAMEIFNKLKAGVKKRPDYLEENFEIYTMTKDIRAKEIERFHEHHRRWKSMLRHKKVHNVREYKLEKMNDVFWQMVHHAGPTSKQQLLLGREEYRKHNTKFAFNFEFVERHDFPEALTADERIELPEDDPNNTETVTGNLDDWGI